MQFFKWFCSVHSSDTVIVSCCKQVAKHKRKMGVCVLGSLNGARDCYNPEISDLYIGVCGRHLIVQTGTCFWLRSGPQSLLAGSHSTESWVTHPQHRWCISPQRMRSTLYQWPGRRPRGMGRHRVCSHLCKTGICLCLHAPSILCFEKTLASFTDWKDAYWAKHWRTIL